MASCDRKSSVRSPHPEIELRLTTSLESRICSSKYLTKQTPSQWPVRVDRIACVFTGITLTDLDRIQELVSAQPVEEGAQERVRLRPLPNPISSIRPRNDPVNAKEREGKKGREKKADVRFSVRKQDQEAQDPPIPFAQRHRPQVPEEPQTCSARDDEGAGTCREGVSRSIRDTDDVVQKEVKEGKRDAA